MNPLGLPDAFTATEPMDLDMGFGTAWALYFNFNLPNSNYQYDHLCMTQIPNLPPLLLHRRLVLLVAQRPTSLQFNITPIVNAWLKDNVLMSAAPLVIWSRGAHFLNHEKILRSQKSFWRLGCPRMIATIYSASSDGVLMARACLLSTNTWRLRVRGSVHQFSWHL